MDPAKIIPRAPPSFDNETERKDEGGKSARRFNSVHSFTSSSFSHPELPKVNRHERVSMRLFRQDNAYQSESLMCCVVKTKLQILSGSMEMSFLFVRPPSQEGQGIRASCS